jgi:hypothetical protein
MLAASDCASLATTCRDRTYRDAVSLFETIPKAAFRSHIGRAIPTPNLSAFPCLRSATVAEKGQSRKFADAFGTFIQDLRDPRATRLRASQPVQDVSTTLHRDRSILGAWHNLRSRISRPGTCHLKLSTVFQANLAMWIYSKIPGSAFCSTTLQMLFTLLWSGSPLPTSW